MATRTFISLENKLAANVPGCPRPTIEQFVRDIAIEVCEKTLVWRYKQPTITLVAGTYEYAYDLPASTEITAVTHTKLSKGGVFADRLFPVTQDDLLRMYPDWPSSDVDKRSQPRYLSQIDPSMFVVAPVPDSSVTYTVDMFLALKPSLSSTGMEETIFNNCENLIIHGVLQHLHTIPDKSWTDYGVASYHAKQYTYKTAAKRAQANLGVVRGPMTVQMRPLE
jgi:hypothetical protein